MSPDQAVAAMVGRELEQLVGRTEQIEIVEESRVPALAFQGLSGTRHEGVDLEVRPGEIVGIAGLPDSGRVELLANAFGGAPGTAGTVLIGGTAYDRRSPLESVRRGLAFVPGERRAQGLLTSMNVGENVSVLLNARLTRGGLLRKRQARVEAGEHAARFRVKTASLDTPIVNLSGGNQQKAILARWLAINPAALILDEPTRGVDVGAKAEIYEQLFALSRKGVGILCSSSDLPELLTITDRIAVMSQGRLVAVIPTSEASEEHIMTLATGAAPVV